MARKVRRISAATRRAARRRLTTPSYLTPTGARSAFAPQLGPGLGLRHERSRGANADLAPGLRFVAAALRARRSDVARRAHRAAAGRRAGRAGGGHAADARARAVVRLAAAIDDLADLLGRLFVPLVGDVL